MPGQSGLPHDEASLPFQFSTDQPASSQAVASQRSIRILWTGLGFAALMLIGVSVGVLTPVALHAPPKPSLSAPAISVISSQDDAFAPSYPLPALSSGRNRAATTGLRPPALSGVVPKRVQPGAVRPAVPLKMTTARARDTQLPREEWPARMKPYRFIKNDDPTLGKYPLTAPSKILDKYEGTRNSGAYKTSFRVTFIPPRGFRVALPGGLGTLAKGGLVEALVDRDPKTIELLKSDRDDNPSFAAVEVKLPFDIAVTQSDLVGTLDLMPIDVTVPELNAGRKRLVVTSVQGANAKFSGIQKGDIIRAVSAPEPGTLQTVWRKVFDDEVSELRYSTYAELSKVQSFVRSLEDTADEQGMVMLDGMGVSAYQAVLQAHTRQRQESVVLVIERPLSFPDEPDSRSGRGIPIWAAAGAGPR